MSIIEEHQDGGSSPLDFFDCQMFAEPGDDYRETSETEDTQQTNMGLAISYTAYAEGSGDEVGVSPLRLRLSFTPVCHDSPLCSQHLPKLPHSPPSPSYTRQHKKRGPAQQE